MEHQGIGRKTSIILCKNCRREKSRTITMPSWKAQFLPIGDDVTDLQVS